MDNAVHETIELSLPLNGAYVSAARLTASSIANRQNFDIDEMEDIKYAVSEACTFLIKKLPNSKTSFVIRFVIAHNRLTIQLSLNTPTDFTYSDDEMSILMIKGLMDDFLTAFDEEGNFFIRFSKEHVDISFE